MAGGEAQEGGEISILKLIDTVQQKPTPHYKAIILQLKINLRLGTRQGVYKIHTKNKQNPSVKIKNEIFKIHNNMYTIVGLPWWLSPSRICLKFRGHGFDPWIKDWKDSLERGMATHLTILAWNVPWREEPGGLQSMGLQRVGHDWEINNFTTSCTIAI